MQCCCLSCYSFSFRFRFVLVSEFWFWNAPFLNLKLVVAVPPLPPFTPHDHRMFLMWSSALLTIVCLYLSYQLLTAFCRNYRRPMYNGARLVFDGSDEFVAFKELTGEQDDTVVDAFLLASDGECQRALNYYMDSKFTASAEWFVFLFLKMNVKNRIRSGRHVRVLNERQRIDRRSAPMRHHGQALRFERHCWRCSSATLRTACRRSSRRTLIRCSVCHTTQQLPMPNVPIAISLLPFIVHKNLRISEFQNSNLVDIAFEQQQQ